MRLGQDVGQDFAEVWLNVFATDAGDELSDIVSRHPSGTWPESESEPELRPVRADTSAYQMGWGPPATGEALERPPPGEPSPYWYRVGWGGLFYWQLAAIATGGVLLFVMSDGGGRRR